MGTTGMRAHCRGRSGLTFVELMLGLSITALVMGAVAAFVTAAGTHWRSSEPGQSVHLAQGQVTVRLQHIVRDSRLIGATRSGSLDSSGAAAALLLWRADSNEDGQIQLSEIALIEHDRTQAALLVYELRLPAEMSSAERSARDHTVSYDAIAEPSAPEAFRSIEHVTPVPLARGISGARFHVHSAGRNQRPALEFALRVNRGGSDGIEYGSATMRGPSRRPE
jgi:hypothetical protein